MRPIHEPLHAVTWLVWAVAAGICIQLAPNPAYVLVTIAVAWVVVEAHNAGGVLARAFPVLLAVGATFGAVKVVLTVLTVHGGPGVLITVPELTLPDVLGGVTLGGTIESEVLAQAGAEALVIAGIMAVFGAFNAIVAHDELVASLPRTFHEPGLVLTVGVAFVPATVTAIRGMHESDLCRTGGVRVRRGRLLRRSLPLLETGLERAMALSEPARPRVASAARSPRPRRGWPAGRRSVPWWASAARSSRWSVRRPSSRPASRSWSGACSVPRCASGRGARPVPATGAGASRAPTSASPPPPRAAVGGLALLRLSGVREPHAGDRAALLARAGPAAPPRGSALLAVPALTPLQTTDTSASVPGGDDAAPADDGGTAVTVAVGRAGEPAAGGRRWTAIELRRVRFAHPDGPVSLVDVDLDVGAGEVVLVSGGSARARARCCGRSTGSSRTRRADASGARCASVGGRPATTCRATWPARSGSATRDREAHVRRRPCGGRRRLRAREPGDRSGGHAPPAEEVLDVLGIAHLRRRSVSTSRRRTPACRHRRGPGRGTEVLVLDEPTSELDPQGADDVLAAVARLNEDLGTTVVVAEHRLRAGRHPSRTARAAGRRHGSPPTGRRAGAGRLPGAPPVTHLGRLLGWDPLPLTVRVDAGRSAAPAPARRSRPRARRAAGRCRRTREGGARGSRAPSRGWPPARAGRRGSPRPPGRGRRAPGRNGSGKTTLLRALAGLHEPQRGAVACHTTRSYVPQDPNSLLFAPTVREELEETVRLRRRDDDGAVAAWLGRLDVTDAADRHPRSLSAGQRQRVAVAAVAVGGAEVLLLDEPTRGMDAPSRAALEAAVTGHARDGERWSSPPTTSSFAARVATTVQVLGDREVVAAGDAHRVLAGSLFAPQVLRVLPPFVTVEQVAAARERAAVSP
ncbi:MAG: ATP-binding cassette domain-containing protein [Acidimicrobiia bacterium]|nr:ATP-binding cassette domain-containing protein [Acidimicrobiia bacterium]